MSSRIPNSWWEKFGKAFGKQPDQEAVDNEGRQAEALFAQGIPMLMARIAAQHPLCLAHAGLDLSEACTRVADEGCDALRRFFAECSDDRLKLLADAAQMTLMAATKDAMEKVRREG